VVVACCSHAPPKPPKAKARAAPQQAAKKSKRIRGEAVPASSLTDDALGKHDGEPGEKKPKVISLTAGQVQVMNLTHTHITHT